MKPSRFSSFSFLMRSSSVRAGPLSATASTTNPASVPIASTDFATSAHMDVTPGLLSVVGSLGTSEILTSSHYIMMKSQMREWSHGNACTALRGQLRIRQRSTSSKKIDARKKISERSSRKVHEKLVWRFISVRDESPQTGDFSLDVDVEHCRTALS